MGATLRSTSGSGRVLGEHRARRRVVYGLRDEGHADDGGDVVGDLVGDVAQLLVPTEGEDGVERGLEAFRLTRVEEERLGDAEQPERARGRLLEALDVRGCRSADARLHLGD